MKTSKRQKGHQFQNWCADWLTEHGYVVHNQKSVARRILTEDNRLIWVSQRNDLFGAFDIIAFNEQEILFIQATLDTAVEKRIKAFEKLPDNPAISFQIWQKTDKNTVRILDRSGQEVGRIIRRKFYTKGEGK